VKAVPLRPGILPRILRVLLRSTGTLMVTLAALLCVTFALSALSPVDPALRLVGDHASAATYQQARHSLGLDLSWPRRLGRYAVDVVHGDLGVSQSTGEPVAQDLRRVFPATAGAISVLRPTAVDWRSGPVG
jgi:peptide/nickel transport system permease protein